MTQSAIANLCGCLLGNHGRMSSTSIYRWSRLASEWIKTAASILAASMHEEYSIHIIYDGLLTLSEGRLELVVLLLFLIQVVKNLTYIHGGVCAATAICHESTCCTFVSTEAMPIVL